jgi:WD40 repeat protein
MFRLCGYLLLAAVLTLGLGTPAHCESAPEGNTAQKNQQPLRTDRYGDPLPPGAIARLGTLRWRHPRAFLLSFAPDGKTLVTAGHDDVRFWDISSGKVLRHRPAPQGMVDQLAVSHDGQKLALGDWDTLVLWDAAAGRARHRIKDAHYCVASVAFSPDGKTAASRNFRDCSVQLWDLATGQRLRRLGTEDHELPSGILNYRPSNLAFSAEGTMVASASEQGELSVWDVTSGKALLRRTEKSRDIRSLCFSPDGKLLVWGDGGDTICWWDLARGRELRRVKSFKAGVRYFAFSPEGETLASGEYDGTIRLWDVRSGKQRYCTKEEPFMVSAVTFSPDGKDLLAVIGGTIRRWEAATGTERQSPEGHSGVVSALVFSPDGKVVASGGHEGTIRMWEIATGRALRRFRHDTDLQALAFASNGRVLAAAYGNAVSLWETTAGKALHQLKCGEQAWVGTIAFTADDKVLVALDSEEVLHCWETQTGKERRQLRKMQQDETLRKGVLSSDGRTLALIYRGEVRNDQGLTRHPLVQVRLGAATTDRELLPFVLQPWSLSDAAFSPDGKTLALALNYTEYPGSGSGRRVPREFCLISLREAATGKERCRLEGLESPASPIAFAPDGRVLAAVCADGAIRLWDLHTGQQVGGFRGHTGGVFALAFSADGTRLASAGVDATVLIWEMPGDGGFPGKQQRAPLDGAALEDCWADLASDRADQAYRAMSLLAASATRAVPFLKEHLQPVAVVDPERMMQRMADLDDARFRVREQAERDLEGYGELAEPALRSALAGNPSPEVRRRVEALLERHKQGTLSADQLRMLRAIEVLEGIGLPAARQLLEKLARGAPAAHLTQEAKAALERLVRRPGPRP